MPRSLRAALLPRLASPFPETAKLVFSPHFVVRCPLISNWRIKLVIRASERREEKVIAFADRIDGQVFRFCISVLGRSRSCHDMFPTDTISELRSYCSKVLITSHDFSKQLKSTRILEVYLRMNMRLKLLPALCFGIRLLLENFNTVTVMQAA